MFEHFHNRKLENGWHVRWRYKLWRKVKHGRELRKAKMRKARRRMGQQRMRPLNSITNSVDMNLSKLQETVRKREAWHAVVMGGKELDVTWRLNSNNKIRISCSSE